VTLTPAARSRRVVVMNDVPLSGFGSKPGKGADQLAGALRQVPPP
jgi:ABC-type hemin transport system substrate-binding protein